MKIIRAEPPHTWFGHPTGLFVISLTDMWERFSYHGMRALFVLFLVAPVSQMGFGWTEEDALRAYGSYVALIYLSPLLGGIISDRHFGPRSGLVAGGVLILTGHLLLTLSHFAPALLESGGHAEYSAILTASGISPGELVLDEAQRSSLIGTARELLGLDHASVGQVLNIYTIQSYSFYGALALIILGTGFFKPSAAALIATLYTASEQSQREAGFTIEYTAINIGSFLAPIVSGAVAATWGWPYGFLCAAIGMTMGLVLFVTLYGRVFRDEGTQQESVTKSDSGPENEGWSTGRIAIFAALMAIISLYWSFYEQWGGLINIFTDQRIDRSLGDYTIPAPILQSLNPLFIIIFSPVLAVLLGGAGSFGRWVADLNAFRKLAIACVLLGAGFASLFAAAAEVAGNGTVLASIWYVVTAYLFIALSELFLAPVALSLFTRIAPVRFVALAAGIFYFTNSVGAYLSGWFGSFASSDGPQAVFGTMMLMSLALALVLQILARKTPAHMLQR